VAEAERAEGDGVEVVGFEVKLLKPGVDDGLVVGVDGERARDGVERPTPDEAAAELRPLEHRRGGVRPCQFHAVEVVLEARVAAVVHDGAVAGDDDRRVERHGQTPLRVEVVAQVVGDAVAGVVGVGKPQQAEGHRGVDALGRVGAAERRLDQLARHLEAVHLLAPDFEHHGVAGARNDGRRVERRVLNRRLEVGGDARHVGRAVEADEQPVGPDAARRDHEAHLPAHERRRANQEALGGVGRDGGHVGAEGVAARGVLPVVGEAGLRVPVAVEQDAPLLVQDAVEVEPALVAPPRKVASHGSFLKPFAPRVTGSYVTGISSGRTPTGMNSRKRICRLRHLCASSRNP
jgi:hypothetical protein